MNVTVHIALIGWIPVVIALFSLLPPRRAVIASFLIAWLFLPMAGYEFSGLPNYTKMSATSAGVLLGMLLFDAGRFLSFRPALVDAPMALWCLVPMISSLDNGLGLYDGASAVLNRTIEWGIPFLIGRMYFSDLAGLRELAVGIFIGGLVYVPLCLFEMRMSPQLHNIVYGFHQHSFAQTKRFGGWRPVVFLQHGLAVGLWMTATSLAGVWLWRSRALRTLQNIPTGLLLSILLATTFITRSLGALALLAVGLGLLFVSRWMRSASIVALAVLLVPLYLGARIVVNWSGDEIVSAVEVIDEDRAASVQLRLSNEDRLMERALQRPIFGWGGWGDFRQIDDDGPRVITDSLWIITLGRNGLVGLAALCAVILVPPVLLLRQTRMRGWDHPAIAPAAVLAVLLVLFMYDSLFNSMLNPIFLLGAGGLSALAASCRSLIVTERRSRWPTAV